MIAYDMGTMSATVKMRLCVCKCARVDMRALPAQTYVHHVHTYARAFLCSTMLAIMHKYATVCIDVNTSGMSGEGARCVSAFRQDEGKGNGHDAPLKARHAWPSPEPGKATPTTCSPSPAPRVPIRKFGSVDYM